MHLLEAGLDCAQPASDFRIRLLKTFSQGLRLISGDRNQPILGLNKATMEKRHRTPLSCEFLLRTSTYPFSTINLLKVLSQKWRCPQGAFINGTKALEADS